MYSQRGEDDFLRIKLGERPVRRILDIGAFDGKTNSNTWWALEAGWTGVLIEPSPWGFIGLLANIGTLPEEQRKDIVALNCGVAPERGIHRFHFSPDQVSTMDEAHYQVWRERGQYRDGFAYFTTIADLIQQFGGPYHLISIDAEGVSPDLFLQLPLGSMSPDAVVVEHNGERLVELGQYAQEAGYVQTWIRGENVIYMRA